MQHVPGLKMKNEYQCPVCHSVLKSDSAKTLINNLAQHLRMHEKRGEIKAGQKFEQMLNSIRNEVGKNQKKARKDR